MEAQFCLQYRLISCNSPTLSTECRQISWHWTKTPYRRSLCFTTQVFNSNARAVVLAAHKILLSKRFTELRASRTSPPVFNWFFAQHIQHNDQICMSFKRMRQLVQHRAAFLFLNNWKDLYWMFNRHRAAFKWLKGCWTNWPIEP